jgi:hypothetical protein
MQTDTQGAARPYRGRQDFPEIRKNAGFQQISSPKKGFAGNPKIFGKPKAPEGVMGPSKETGAFGLQVNESTAGENGADPVAPDSIPAPQRPLLQRSLEFPG